MYVAAIAYDTYAQKTAEMAFEGFAEISPHDLVQEALHRLLRVVSSRSFTRIEIKLK